MKEAELHPEVRRALKNFDRGITTEGGFRRQLAHLYIQHIITQAQADDGVKMLDEVEEPETEV